MERDWRRRRGKKNQKKQTQIQSRRKRFETDEHGSTITLSTSLQLLRFRSQVCFSLHLAACIFLFFEFALFKWINSLEQYSSTFFEL
jgi:hypothetical protein